MKKDIEKCKDLFESISCLCCEGPELMSKMELMSAINKDAGKGYDICKRHLIAHAPDTKPQCDHEWVGLYGHPAVYECKKCKALRR